MASITFEGPDAQGNRISTVIQMDDAALALVVEAVCATEGYVGDAPGLFVINKSIETWKHTVNLYQKAKAEAMITASVAQTIAPLVESLVVSVNGAVVNIIPTDNTPI